MSHYKEIFDYEHTSEAEIFKTIYVDITLKKSIGKFRSGSKFKFAIIDSDNNILSLVNGNKIYGFNYRVTYEFFESGE